MYLYVRYPNTCVPQLSHTRENEDGKNMRDCNQIKSESALRMMVMQEDSYVGPRGMLVGTTPQAAISCPPVPLE